MRALQGKCIASRIPIDLCANSVPIAAQPKFAALQDLVFVPQQRKRELQLARSRIFLPLAADADRDVLPEELLDLGSAPI